MKTKLNNKKFQSSITVLNQIEKKGLIGGIGPILIDTTTEPVNPKEIIFISDAWEWIKSIL